jgi:hypothetical protein
MQDEKWVDIQGFESFYQISNFGRIKSLERKVINHKSGSCRRISEHLLTRSKVNSSGYKNVCLYRNNKSKHFYIHRLVAAYFLSAIEGKTFVNHKNGNKQDNFVENLEWCTSLENIQHSITTGLSNTKSNCKKVKDNSTGKEYESIKSAALSLGLAVSTTTHKLSGKKYNDTNLVYL